MASKKEIFASAMEICKEHKVSEKFTAALTTLLEPKSGGSSVDLSTVTKVDDKTGKVTHIQCSLSGVWLPATSVFFYDDKTGKGIEGTDGSMLKRVSKQGETIRKQHAKALSATEKAIMSDVLNEDIKPDEGKAKLEEARAVKPDYSKVTSKVSSSENK